MLKQACAWQMEKLIQSLQNQPHFLDNSRAALAKSAERDVIWNDMREQAARQLINKMAALQHQVQGK